MRKHTALNLRTYAHGHTHTVVFLVTKQQKGCLVSNKATENLHNTTNKMYCDYLRTIKAFVGWDTMTQHLNIASEKEME